MIFQDDPNLYRPRRNPWSALLLCSLCFVLALAIVLGVRARMKKSAESNLDPELEASATNENVPPVVPPTTPVPTATPHAGQASNPVVQTSRPAPPPRPLPGASGDALLAERGTLMARLAAAQGADRASVEARLGEINVYLATSPVPGDRKIQHTVASGESLAKLADRYVCPISLIKRINGLNDNNIRLGQKLVILDHPQFAIEVSKSANTLLLTLNGEFFKRYPVCTGAGGKTPSGTYQIVVKTEKPDWWTNGQKIPYGDKRNILGTRWMGMEATGSTPRKEGLGIHGTWDEASIGTSTSDGCIRMRNADVEEIFTLIPRNPHVSVTIRD